MYFDNCQNPKELGSLIKDILDCCFEDNALSPELLERLFPASERTWPNSLPMYLSTLYNKARYKALEFREENPHLPSLPKEQEIGFKGLESILEWCIDSQKPAEIQQSQQTEIRSEIKLLEQVADKLEEWANRVEPKLPAHIGHISFYGSLLKALGNLPDLMLTFLGSHMPEQLDSIQKDLDDLYEKAKAVDHERSESDGEANILKCQAQAAATRLAKKLRLLEGIVESRHEQVEIREKPAEPEQNTTPAKWRRTWTCVKEIPRWIYYLVGFLAALLTCLYLLWWLWTNFLA